MFTVASYARKVESIRHPNTPTFQTPRTFGEGLLAEPFRRLASFGGPVTPNAWDDEDETTPAVEPTPVNRVAAFLPAAKSDAPTAPTWTEIEWKRAAAFGLRVPTGMKRSAPVAVEATVVVEALAPVVEVETPAPAPMKAAARCSSGPILLVRGERQTWTFEPAVDCSSKMMSNPAPVALKAPARPIRLARGETQVWDAAREVWTYRRAILAPSLPTVDEVWNQGWGLAVAGIDAAPLSDWPADLKTRFLDGLAWGQEQLDADRQEDADRYAEACESANRESFAESMEEVECFA